MSNNPPDVSLELTAEQAKFLLRNCDSNIAFALGSLQTVGRDTAEKMVVVMEQFKEIRAKLIAQGIKND